MTKCSFFWRQPCIYIYICIKNIKKSFLPKTFEEQCIFWTMQPIFDLLFLYCSNVNIVVIRIFCNLIRWEMQSRINRSDSYSYSVNMFNETSVTILTTHFFISQFFHLQHCYFCILIFLMIELFNNNSKCSFICVTHNVFFYSLRNVWL